jgi:CDP-4-dehydro-6-deoxyglucose reductase, E3
VSAPATQQATLVKRRPLSPRVSLITLQFENQIDFIPGQWMSLVFPLFDEKQKPIRRSYSIASARSSNEVELAVTRVDSGMASNYLHDAPLNTPLETKGPQGTFFHTPNTPSLFVATGTGIAPFRPMLHAAIARGDVNSIHILFGARSQHDELFAQEFAQLSKGSSRLKFITSLSQPSAGWNGKTGYVQTHVAECFSQLQNASTAPVHVWVCGVRKMLDEVRKVLKNDFQLDRTRIHAESYD